MHEKFTDSAHRLEGQPMFQLLEKVKQLEAQGRDIVHFEIGDPHFNSPKVAVEACLESLKNNETHYTSSFGLTELREAIADFTQRDLGFSPFLNQILVSPGANPLIYFIIQCLVKPHEEVIVTDPAFSTYYSVLNFLNIKTVRVPLREENKFRIDFQDLKEKISPRTKLLIINSPQNPTGSVLTQEEVSAIGQLAKQHDFFILSDEIYRHMTYSLPPASVSIVDKCKERTIIITSFSKSFAMTGWRLGYMIGPEALVERISLLLQTIVSCVPPFIQKAGMAILQNHNAEVSRVIGELRGCRDLMVRELNGLPGVSCIMPEGAFYAFPNIQKTGLTSAEFSNLMLEEAGVALLPGTNFGKYGEGYVRLCFATSPENIREGLRRMKQILSSSSAAAPGEKILKL